MKSLVKRLKKYKLLYLVLLVAMAYYFVMLYIPIFWGFELSFKEMKIGSTISGAPWVGLQNYKYVFSNPEIFKLLKNKFCQTMVYIPHFFSWVIIYGIVYAFFSGNGFVNGIIRMFGGQPENFLTSSKAFVPLLIGSQLWKEVGWNTILYFAALTSVDTQLYEAAKIDGAGPIQRVKAVTFPAMKPVITFSLIMALGNILNNDFEQILLFYNSAVYEVGDVIDTWVYRVGLGQMQYGVGSAVSMLKAVISLVLILSANKISKKATGRGMF